MYAAASDATQRTSAIEELETYLTTSSSAANWWPLAYEQYAKLCKDQGVEAKTQDELRKSANTQYRLVTGITLPGGATITLNDSLEALQQSLGEGREQEVVKGSNIRRLQYTEQGIEVLAANRIVALRLRGPAAPPVVIRASGPGGETHEVRPGMTLADLDSILGGDATRWDQRYGANTQVVYRFYTRLGFGVRLAGDKVIEIIVAQIPIEAKL